MNIEEVSKLLNVSISSLETNFPKTKLKMEKKGIILNKEGRGKNAVYTVEYTNLFNDTRALSIFEENQKEVFLRGRNVSDAPGKK